MTLPPGRGGPDYLDAVVKETLRLRPVVPAVLRAVASAVEQLTPVGDSEGALRRGVTLVPRREATVRVTRRAAPAPRAQPVPTGR